MKRKFIPADESFARWKKDPRFVAAYNALEAEFALAASLITILANASLFKLLKPAPAPLTPVEAETAAVA